MQRKNVFKNKGSDKGYLNEITKRTPEKKLVFGKKITAGRNNSGKITVRFRGNGHKRRLRIIDFKRRKTNIFAKVLGIEYDPNRSARLALIQYLDGIKQYILAPLNIAVSDNVISSDKAEVKIGNHVQINNIPVGTQIHNIEMRPLKGGQLVRAAGTFAQLMAKKKSYATVKLPSGETRLIHVKCSATIGQLGNISHELKKIHKAGRNRWFGRRPHNRGVAMNPVDHPLGGGEGKSSGGRHPVSPWGKSTKGYRTRNNKRTDKMIIVRRK